MPAKLTQEVAEQRVQQKCKEMNYTCSEFVYMGNRTTYLPLKCHCGHEWNSTSYSDFVNGGKGCPKCGGSKKLTQEEAEQRVQHKCTEMNYTCSEFVYSGSTTTYLPLKCHCGHEWDSTNYTSFVHQGIGCSKCGVGEAKCISHDIDPYFDDFEKEKKFDKCRDRRKLPFDRFVPYLNLLLEYDGEQHFVYKSIWHKSRTEFEKSQKRDKIKTEYAINNGYNFIRIAYYEDHVQALESFLAVVQEHPDKQIVQIYGELQILDKKS